MKHYTALAVVLLCHVYAINAQRTVYGYVQDSASGERIVNAYIKVLGEDVSTTSNNYGYFTLKTNLDSCLLMVSNAGYENNSVLVLKSTPLPLILPLIQVTTFSVVAKAKKDDKVVNSTQMSSISITMAQIRMLPRFFGETDIIKAIQLMPGIK